MNEEIARAALAAKYERVTLLPPTMLMDILKVIVTHCRPEFDDWLEEYDKRG